MNEQPARLHHRRFFRFTLRTILLLVATLCLLLAWNVSKARQQRAGVVNLRKMGVWVVYEHKPPAWLRNLVGIDNLFRVKHVFLRDSGISDATPLAKLTYLDNLDFSGTRVSDLTPLAKLTNLRTLILNGAPVSDLAPLAKLTHLEFLLLCETQVSDVAPLTKLKSLIRLDICDTQVSDVSPLADLDLLELNLSGTKVSDVAPLSRLKNLAELDITNTQVSERSVQQLRQALPNLVITRYQ